MEGVWAESNGAIKSLFVLKRGLKKGVEIKENVRLVFINSGSGERFRRGRRQGLQGGGGGSDGFGQSGHLLYTLIIGLFVLFMTFDHDHTCRSFGTCR